MNKKQQVFIDTSFIKAVFDPKDDFCAESGEIWAKANKEGWELLTSNYILDEMFTLLRKRCGLEVVRKIKKDLLETKAIKILRVTVGDESNAWNWFENDWSGLSFTDCVSFAVMKRLNLKKVLTFDSHFSRAGFEVMK